MRTEAQNVTNIQIVILTGQKDHKPTNQYTKYYIYRMYR